MKKSLVVLLCLGLSITAATAQTKKKSTKSNEKKMELKTEKDTLSYAIGADIGGNFKRMDVEINPDALIKGLTDAMAEKAVLTEDQKKNIIMAWQQGLQAKMQAKAQEAGKENLKKGQEFLAKNKLTPGVIERSSGLQYQILTLGEGPKPADTSVVRVHYKGTLLDGKVFDSSYDRGEATEFPLNRVIPGWTEGLQLMPVGSKFRFWIPSALAYGEQGAGEAIGPNETLVFDVELLGIVK